jgi:dihydroceramide fatty acyl 2-hydroxylase
MMNRQDYMKKFRTPIWQPFAVFGPLAVLLLVIGFMTAQNTVAGSLLIIGIGLFSWTVAEYFFHRFPFHNPTTKEPWRFLSSGQHLLHHEIPNHPNYVAAPLIMSLIIYSVIMAIVLLISRSVSATLLWGGSFAIAYLLYETIHYYAHHGRPTTALGRYLKRYHLVHHFKDSNNYYGVTSPLWDWILGTKPKYDASRDTEILPIVSRAKG